MGSRDGDTGPDHYDNNLRRPTMPIKRSEIIKSHIPGPGSFVTLIYRLFHIYRRELNDAQRPTRTIYLKRNSRINNAPGTPKRASSKIFTAQIIKKPFQYTHGPWQWNKSSCENNTYLLSYLLKIDDSKKRFRLVYLIIRIYLLHQPIPTQ